MKKLLALSASVWMLASVAAAETAETPANLVRLGGGAAFPSSGAGWVTDHLQPGWMGALSYDRFLSQYLALEAGGSWQTNPVDTGGTSASDLDLHSDTWGLRAGLRVDVAAVKPLHLYADAGLGYYQSLLFADNDQEDAADGWGTPLGVGGDLFLPSHLSVGLRLGFLPFFMTEGASFNSLELQLLVGSHWGKFHAGSPGRDRSRRDDDLRVPD